MTFLDPCTKSGVFLREITSRLTKGLEAQIPDLQKRVDHILTKQVFGIAITQLTSLLARRSLYCSKHAQGEHSIAKGFDRDDGNVWFERTKHKWTAENANIVGPARNRLIAARVWKPMPMRSSTLTISKLGLPGCLEAICNLT